MRYGNARVLFLLLLLSLDPVKLDSPKVTAALQTERSNEALDLGTKSIDQFSNQKVTET